MRRAKLHAALVATAAATLALAACGESPTTTARDTLSPPDELARHVGPNSSPSSIIDVQDLPLVEGQCIKFSGARSTDPDYGDRTSLTFAWSFGDGGTAIGRFPCHAYPDNDTYTVSLTVTDMHGAVGMTTTQVFISNANPNPGPISVTPTPPLMEGNTFVVALDSARDAPSDVTAGLEYSFNCGVGGWTPWSTSAFYICPGLPDNGTYSVGGQVRDKDGGAVITHGPLPVQNENPECTYTYNRTGGWMAVVVTCNDAPGDRLITCAVTWGDGSPDRVVTFGRTLTISPDHKYVWGSYTITVICTDKDGGAASDTHPFTIP